METVFEHHVVFLLSQIAFVLVALAAASATALPTGEQHWPAFKQFMLEHQRSYGSDRETEKRYEIFKENLKRIAQRNARGGAKHGVNKFTDLSPEEFKKRYLGFTPPPGFSNSTRRTNSSYGMLFRTLRTSQ